MVQQGLHRTRRETTALNGACLGVTPGACQAQLPSLFAAAADRWRMAAIEGNGYLYPLLASGYARIDDAAEAHARLFGFQPAHPAGGQWRWETGEVVSSLYGSAGHQKQPAYQDGDRSFGVLKEIAHLDVSMQFEDTGLRTRVCWQPK